MIRLPPRSAGLNGAERYALDLLVDLARLVPIDAPNADVTRLEVVLRHGGSSDIRSCMRRGWFIECRDGVVGVPRVVLRHVVDVAGAAVEQRSTVRDRFDRVPPEENPLVAHRVEQEPVISRAAARLRDAVVAAAGRRVVRLVAPWPRGKRWGAAFTHALDVVDYWPAFTLLRLVELARRGELARAARVVGAAGAALVRNPVWRGVLEVLACEREHRIGSSWFVLCGTPTFATMRAGDLTYRPEGRAATRIMRELAQRGHEIGLHGSFATLDREDIFETQRTRRERAIGRPVTGVRQHFIRMHSGATQRAMAAARFGYDASYGFPAVMASDWAWRTLFRDGMPMPNSRLSWKRCP